jgi:septal ring factor EnvC (AmiA/AmiB activator)
MEELVKQLKEKINALKDENSSLKLNLVASNSNNDKNKQTIKNLTDQKNNLISQ